MLQKRERGGKSGGIFEKMVSRRQKELAPLAPAATQKKSCSPGGSDVGESVCVEVGRTPECEKNILFGFV